MADVLFKGTPAHTNGDLPKVGSTAPDFKLTNGDLKEVSLADFKGKKKLLSIAHSLDTLAGGAAGTLEELLNADQRARSIAEAYLSDKHP